jgi:hypothetical protein
VKVDRNKICQIITNIIVNKFRRFALSKGAGAAIRITIPRYYVSVLYVDSFFMLLQ